MADLLVFVKNSRGFVLGGLSVKSLSEQSSVYSIASFGFTHTSHPSFQPPVNRPCICGSKHYVRAARWWRSGTTRGRSSGVLAGCRSSVN